MARRLLITLLAAVMTALAVMTPAAADTTSWVHVPVPAQVRPQAALNGAVAFGPDRAWAVGVDAAAGTAPGRPLVLSWDGTTWQRHALPGMDWQGELLSVAGNTPDTVWAVGRDAAGAARLLHYDGTAWHPCRAPRGVDLSKVVTGAGETWLIGTRDGAQVLLRRERHTWRELPVPPGRVYGLHILDADDVWAAGANNGAAVSHWDGEEWQQTIVSGTPRSAVGSVLAVSPTEVWAGGTAGFIGGPPGRPIPPLLARWDGQTWNRATLPTDFGAITSLAPDASGDLGWISVVRSLKWAPPGSPTTLIPGPDFVSWNGQTFTGYDEPAVAGEGDSSHLNLAPVPGSTTAWSVGRAPVTGEDAFAPRILRFD